MSERKPNNGKCELCHYQFREDHGETPYTRSGLRLCESCDDNWGGYLCEKNNRIAELEAQNKRIVDRSYECNKATIDQICVVANALRELALMMKGLQDACELSDYYDLEKYIKIASQKTPPIDIPQEIAELEAQVASLHLLVEVQRKRMEPWIAKWRKATGANDLTYPDLGELLEWIDDRVSFLEEAWDSGKWKRMYQDLFRAIIRSNDHGDDCECDLCLILESEKENEDGKG